MLALSLETSPVAAAPLPVASKGALHSLSIGLRNRNCGSQPVRLLFEKVWRARKGNLIAWGEHLADQSTLLTCEKREASSSDKDGTPETNPMAKISLVVVRPCVASFSHSGLRTLGDLPGIATCGTPHHRWRSRLASATCITAASDHCSNSVACCSSGEARMAVHVHLRLGGGRREARGRPPNGQRAGGRPPRHRALTHGRDRALVGRL